MKEPKYHTDGIFYNISIDTKRIKELINELEVEFLKIKNKKKMNDGRVIFNLGMITKEIYSAFELHEKLSDKMYLVRVVLKTSHEYDLIKLINIEDCQGFYIVSGVDEFNKLNNK